MAEETRPAEDQAPADAPDTANGSDPGPSGTTDEVTTRPVEGQQNIHAGLSEEEQDALLKVGAPVSHALASSLSCLS